MVNTMFQNFIGVGKVSISEQKLLSKVDIFVLMVKDGRASMTSLIPDCIKDDIF